MLYVPAPGSTDWSGCATQPVPGCLPHGFVRTAKMNTHLKRLLPENAFVRKVLALISGTMMGQVVIVAVMPVVTRLYSPDDLGALAVFRSIIATLAVVATLRYQTAIPVPKDDDDAVSLVRVGFAVLFTMVALTGLGLVGLGSPLVELLKVPRLTRYLWLIPIGLCCIGAYQLLSYLAIRQGVFKQLAFTRLTQALVTALVPVLAFPLGIVALLVAQMFGQSMGGDAAVSCDPAGNPAVCH